MLKFVFYFVVLYCCLACHASAGTDITQGFEDTDQKKWSLLPCNRPENSFSSDSTKFISGKRSAKLIVRPLRKVPLAGHNCITKEKKEIQYEPDGDERAELWEPDSLWLKSGADAWYGFSFHITALLTNLSHVCSLVNGKKRVEEALI